MLWYFPRCPAGTVQPRHRAPLWKPASASRFRQRVLLGLCHAIYICIPCALSVDLGLDPSWIFLPELWQTINSLLYLLPAFSARRQRVRRGSLSSCIIPAGSDAPPASRFPTLASTEQRRARCHSLLNTTRRGCRRGKRSCRGKQEAFCGNPSCFLGRKQSKEAQLGGVPAAGGWLRRCAASLLGISPHLLRKCKQGFAGVRALLWKGKEVSRYGCCCLLGS